MSSEVFRVLLKNDFELTKNLYVQWRLDVEKVYEREREGLYTDGLPDISFEGFIKDILLEGLYCKSSDGLSIENELKAAKKVYQDTEDYKKAHENDTKLFLFYEDYDEFMHVKKLKGVTDSDTHDWHGIY